MARGGAARRVSRKGYSHATIQQQRGVIHTSSPATRMLSLTHLINVDDLFLFVGENIFPVAIEPAKEQTALRYLVRVLARPPAQPTKASDKKH